MTKRGALWIPVDVEFVDPAGNKYELDDPAVLAYIRLLAWCKRKRKDGLIPFSRATAILNGTAAELESAGLIAVDDDNYVIIRDWHKWHESADELEKRRAAERERKRLQREAMSSKNSSPSPKEKRRGEEGNRADIRPDVPADNVKWNMTCRHGAPYNGRGCIECRTGRDFG